MLFVSGTSILDQNCFPRSLVQGQVWEWKSLEDILDLLEEATHCGMGNWLIQYWNLRKLRSSSPSWFLRKHPGTAIGRKMMWRARPSPATASWLGWYLTAQPARLLETNFWKGKDDHHSSFYIDVCIYIYNIYIFILTYIHYIHLIYLYIYT